VNAIPEPRPARPSCPEDGPPPEVWTWPYGDRPALQVWSAGVWRRAPVLARQNWADGSVRYQVEVDLRGDAMVTVRAYRWPQSGLRKGCDSGSKPSRTADGQRQGMSRARPRRV
jgi:hypothetical protein